MQARGSSYVEGYSKTGKSAMNAHLSVGSHRHSSSSQHKDRVQKQRSGDSKNLLLQKSGVHKATSERSKHQKIQGALRGCGNWSEHVSSSGKIYFYNNVSEVSQWEKPKDWNDETAIDLKAKEKSKLSSQRSNSKNHRSSHTTSSKSHSNTDADKDYRSRKDFCDRDYRTKPTSGDHDYRDIDYRDVSSRSGDGRENNQKCASTDKDYRSLNSRFSTNSHSLSNKSLIDNSSNGHLSAKQENYVPSTGEFYDYSTWNTNTSSTDSKLVNGVPHSTENSQSSQHSADAASHHIPTTISETKNNNSAASEFVRQLSNALTQAASTSSKDTNKPDGNLKDVFQLLLSAAAKSQSEKALPENQDNSTNNNESEVTGAPAAKRPCVENVNNIEQKEKDQSEAAVDNIPEPQFPSLEEFKSVFDPSSIFHVQNWPVEHHEKQCHRLSDDYHRFVADHMSELNVQLTHARSQVRASEILSTLQEQRVLYIRQQIKDLESSSTGSAPFT